MIGVQHPETLPASSCHEPIRKGSLHVLRRRPSGAQVARVDPHALGVVQMADETRQVGRGEGGSTDGGPVLRGARAHGGGLLCHPPVRELAGALAARAEREHDQRIRRAVRVAGLAERVQRPPAVATVQALAGDVQQAAGLGMASLPFAIPALAIALGGHRTASSWEGGRGGAGGWQ